MRRYGADLRHGVHKGVLIHINPDELTRVYDNLHTLSARYVMVCEYYNPAPVVVNYRGIEDRLFKRDFITKSSTVGMRLVITALPHRTIFPPGRLDLVPSRKMSRDDRSPRCRIRGGLALLYATAFIFCR